MTYLVITQARVTPGYRDAAIDNIKLLKNVALINGAKCVRIAVNQTGSNIGKFMLFLLFESMSDTESVYDAFSEYPIYAETLRSGKIEITERSMLKIHIEVDKVPPSNNLKYLVLTNIFSKKKNLDIANCFAHILTNNGAYNAKYGTLFAGDKANRKMHLFASTYPSLVAIQSAYSALENHEISSQIDQVLDIQGRQVLRVLD